MWFANGRKSGSSKSVVVFFLLFKGLEIVKHSLSLSER